MVALGLHRGHEDCLYNQETQGSDQTGSAQAVPSSKTTDDRHQGAALEPQVEGTPLRHTERKGISIVATFYSVISYVVQGEHVC